MQAAPGLLTQTAWTDQTTIRGAFERQMTIGSELRDRTSLVIAGCRRRSAVSFCFVYGGFIMFSMANTSVAAQAAHAPFPLSLNDLPPHWQPLRTIAQRQFVRRAVDGGPLGNLSAVEADRLVETLHINETEPMTAEEFLLSLGGGRLPSASGTTATSSESPSTPSGASTSGSSSMYGGSSTPDSPSTSGGASMPDAPSTFGISSTPGNPTTSGRSSTSHRLSAPQDSPSTFSRPATGLAPRADSDRCFTSFGDYDIRHPEADAATPSPTTSTQRRAHAWTVDQEGLGFYDGLNTFGHEVQTVIDHTLPLWSFRTKYAVALPGTRGTLNRIRVAVPAGTLGILRVGAQSESGGFEMRVRTGGDRCGGVHRVIPCELDAQRQQCNVAFEAGEVDGQRSVLVEIFSKSDGQIEFYAQ
ncbi:MAG TPA: hypothetical protein VL424_14820 [Pararobbsia sp.]|nr:hypothetical protein [Pararobbsia sp.]